MIDKTKIITNKKNIFTEKKMATALDLEIRHLKTTLEKAEKAKALVQAVMKDSKVVKKPAATKQKQDVSSAAAAPKASKPKDEKKNKPKEEKKK